jgi:hypothetical protein
MHAESHCRTRKELKSARALSHLSQLTAGSGVISPDNLGNAIKTETKEMKMYTPFAHEVADYGPGRRRRI